MRVNFTICRKRYCIATRICHEWAACALTSSFRYGARSLNPTINLCERVRVERERHRASEWVNECVFVCIVFFIHSSGARNKCTMTWKVNSVFRSTLAHYLFLSAGCYRCSECYCSCCCSSFSSSSLCTFLCDIVLPTLFLITLYECVCVCSFAK